MMLLVLSEDHMEHLALLSKVDRPVVAEFACMALEILKRGTSSKIYEGASRKLAVPVDWVQRGVEGLMFLMTESSKYLISDEDFLDSILSLDLGEEVAHILLKLYQEHQGQIRSALHWLPHKLPAYHNLEWRLDVQLASRCVHQQLVPMVTLNVSLMSGNDSVSSRVLQTEPGTLLHIISTLEAALETSKTSHARRMLRSI